MKTCLLFFAIIVVLWSYCFLQTSNGLHVCAQTVAEGDLEHEYILKHNRMFHLQMFGECVMESERLRLLAEWQDESRDTVTFGGLVFPKELYYVPKQGGVHAKSILYPLIVSFVLCQEKRPTRDVREKKFFYGPGYLRPCTLRKTISDIFDEFERDNPYIQISVVQMEKESYFSERAGCTYVVFTGVPPPL